MSCKVFTFFFIIVGLSRSVFACEAPSIAEAEAFFQGNREWQLVDGADSNLENQSKEVIINLNFENHAGSWVLWNGEPANVRRLQVCKTDNPAQMEVKSNWPRVRVTRLRGGRIQAKALGIPFYMLPSHRVARASN